MANTPDVTKLAEVLRFDPWWRHGDPVPPWVLQLLDTSALRQLAVVEAELQKSIIEAQLQAAIRTQQILAKGQ